MNAHHARPMLAFWCLAVIAAVITSLGLRSGVSQVEVHAGRPAPVTTSAAPEVLLGGLLDARPVVPAAPLPASSPAVVAHRSAGAGSTPIGSVATTPRPRSHASGSGGSTAVSTGTTATGSTTTATTTTSTHGQGSGPKDTATSTTKPQKGRSDDARSTARASTRSAG